jgi:hypothetical protein
MRLRPLDVSLVRASSVISYHQRKSESNGANCESGLRYHPNVHQVDDYVKLAGHSTRAIIEPIEVQGELISRLIRNECPRLS